MWKSRRLVIEAKWQKGNLIDCRDFRFQGESLLRISSLFLSEKRIKCVRRFAKNKDRTKSRSKCRESLGDSFSLSLSYSPLRSFSHSLFPFAFFFYSFFHSSPFSLSGREKYRYLVVISSTDVWCPINLVTDVISISAGTNRDSTETVLTFPDRCVVIVQPFRSITIPFKRFDYVLKNLTFVTVHRGQRCQVIIVSITSNSLKRISENRSTTRRQEVEINT